MLTVTKLDPKVEEWGEFEWFFEVVQKQGQYQMQNWRQYNSYMEPYAGGVNQSNDGYNMDYSGTAGNYGDGTGGMTNDNDYGDY